MSPTFRVLCTLVSTTGLAALLSVAGARDAEAESHRRGPPPQAIEACEELEPVTDPRPARSPRHERCRGGVCHEAQRSIPRIEVAVRSITSWRSSTVRV